MTNVFLRTCKILDTKAHSLMTASRHSTKDLAAVGFGMVFGAAMVVKLTGSILAVPMAALGIYIGIRALTIEVA